MYSPFREREIDVTEFVEDLDNLCGCPHLEGFVAPYREQTTIGVDMPKNTSYTPKVPEET